MNQIRISKTVAVFLSVTLLVMVAAGGTLAWLAAQSDEVVNTFTYGDVDITLNESKLLADGTLDTTVRVTENTYKMVPGAVLPKDPTITVLADSEKVYLFAEIEKSANFTYDSKEYKFDDYLSFTVDDTQWIAIDDGDGSDLTTVYYRVVDGSSADQPFGILKDNRITVKGEVTKEMLNALDDSGNAPAGDENYPKLTVTGYAMQYIGFEPKDANDAVIASPTADELKASAQAAWVAMNAQLNPPTNP